MKHKSFCLTLMLVLLGLPALADHHEKEMAMEEETAMPASGYPGSFVRDFERVSGKLLDLSAEIPADKYGWRPTEEVRSVSESYIHVALANFFLSSNLGVPAPEGYGPDSEKTITAKDDVIQALRDSIGHVEQAIRKNAGADLEEEIDFFGAKRPKRDALMVISGHSHEHLGQLIAYARSNGVVPPWSQPAEAEDGGGDEDGEDDESEE
jgi:uncharacterized damage-inducible protein DinB